MPSKRKAEGRRRWTLSALAALVGIVLGAFTFQILTLPAPPEVVDVVPSQVEIAAVARRRPEFSLLNLDGELQAVSSWDGSLLVINFWATWCPPCLHEIPFFIELQRKYEKHGLQFLGVAIDERDNVRDFYQNMGMNYPTLHGQLDAIEVSRSYGNSTGGLPFTAFVGRDGTILLTKNGPFEAAEVERIILEHL